MSRLRTNKIAFTQVVHNQSGFLLLQTMVACAIATIVILALSEVVIQVKRREVAINQKLNLVEVRNDIISVLSSDVAWQKTVQHAQNNSAAAVCLRGTNGDVGAPLDCAGKSGKLTVISWSGDMVLDSVKENLGYSLGGAKCETYDPAHTDVNCPVRLTARWSTDCPPAACTMRNPPLIIEIKFAVDYSSGIINPAQLNFTLKR